MSIVHPDFYKDPFGGDGLLLADHPDRRTWARRVAPDTWETVTVENVEPVFETNAALRSINQGKKWKDGRVVASIPESIFYHGDVKKAFDNNDQKWLKRFLNSSDNSKFRTFEGDL